MPGRLRHCISVELYAINKYYTRAVRTEDFYSPPGEKSYFATGEYSCGLRIQPFLPAPRRLERFASVPVGEERASKISYLGERSKPCENARASEAARGQRNPFSAPPPLSRLLSCASRASTFHDIRNLSNGELARRLRGAKRNPVFSLARAYKHRLHF